MRMRMTRLLLGCASLALLATTSGCPAKVRAPDAAGFDAGSDGVIDGGIDGGMDASTDAGLDARVMADVGVDAAPVPTPTFALDFEPIALPGEPVALTDLVFLPGGDEFLVSERTGRLLRYALDTEAGTATLIDEVVIEVDVDRECGLISLAIDPEFATNHAFYMGYCTAPGTSVLARAELHASEGLATVPASTTILITVSGADAGWHNVGAIDFGPDRTLHVLFGDKGMADLAQSLDARNGKLLRIIPHADGSGYDPAPGNPYGTEGIAAEVLALGLRSPWRGFVDSRGRFWIGDVGNHRFEEVDLVGADGANFGWPLAEGPCALPDGGCAELVDPLTYYGHAARDPFIADDPEASATIGRSVWVGLEYRGETIDRYDGALTGRVLFGDIAIGFVRSIRVDETGRVLEHGNVGHLQGASAWREGPDGWIYALGYGSADAAPVMPGGLYRVVMAGSGAE